MQEIEHFHCNTKYICCENIISIILKIKLIRKPYDINNTLIKEEQFLLNVN